MDSKDIRLKNLKPFTGADDPRRVTGSVKKGIPHSKTRLRRLLELTENLTNPITHEVEGFTVLEQLDLAQIIKARKGDTKAYNAILDRLEGKPQQTIDHTTDGESLNNIGLIDLLAKLLSDYDAEAKNKENIEGISELIAEGKDKP